MSSPTSRRRAARQAQFRRRRVVAVILLLVVVVLVIILFRQCSKAGGTAPKATASTSATPTGLQPLPSTIDGASNAQPSASAQPTASPQSQTAASPSVQAGPATCDPSQVSLTAETDSNSYGSGAQPKLSMTLTNTGVGDCTFNVGTKVQKFVITSGTETYWSSADCPKDATDQVVTLKPGVAVSSASPIVWDRTRSNPAACGKPGQTVPAGGAAYHLTVSIGGVTSASYKQFLLY